MIDQISLFPVACPHYRERDYCTYIQPAAFRAHVLADAQTADDLVRVALGYSAILLWSLQEQELRQLACAPAHLSRGELETLLKRVQRCVFIDTLLLDEATLARNALAHPGSEDRQAPSPLLALEPYRVVQALTRWSLHNARSFVFEERSDEEAALVQQVVTTIGHHHEVFSAAAAGLSVVLVARPATAAASLGELFPIETLHELTKTSLAVCHPDPSSDERTFVVTHQVFEVWFTVVVTTLQEVIALLQTPFPDSWAAGRLINRLTAFFRHFCGLIRLPETMSPQDYVRFRPRLAEVGSGAESIQFRAIEILLGLRADRYRTSLEHIGVLTPDLRELWGTPSLNDAFLALLKFQGGFPETADSPSLIRHLAERLGAGHQARAQADVCSLVRELEGLEHMVMAWRVAHLDMVDHMIGARSAMRVGGQKRGGIGRTYLQRTLTYPPLFPEIQAARCLLAEQRSEFAPLDDVARKEHV